MLVLVDDDVVGDGRKWPLQITPSSDHSRITDQK